MLEGVLNIDKPLGLTSHDVVARVRRHGRLRRVGHAGTLDPLATGVLVVCLGRATRLVEYLVGQPKTYETVVRLGETTNTYDAEGEVTAVLPVPTGLTTAVLEPILDRFRGHIQQIPPMYSAIKKDGQPLYKMARRGESIEIPPRPVTIYDLTLVAWEPPHLSLRVTCSAGTYIRSLGHDIGQALGCGGHLVQLRRTAVGALTTATAVALDDLTPENIASYLQPPDTAVSHLPRLNLSTPETQDLYQGRHIAHQTNHPAAELVRAYDAHGRFAGIVVAHGGQTQWRPHKMFTPIADS